MCSTNIGGCVQLTLGDVFNSCWGVCWTVFSTWCLFTMLVMCWAHIGECWCCVHVVECSVVLSAVSEHGQQCESAALLPWSTRDQRTIVISTTHWLTANITPMTDGQLAPGWSLSLITSWNKMLLPPVAAVLGHKCGLYWLVLCVYVSAPSLACLYCAVLAGGCWMLPVACIGRPVAGRWSDRLFHSPLAQPYLQVIRAEEDCQWPVKNGGNSHHPHEHNGYTSRLQAMCFIPLTVL